MQPHPAFLDSNALSAALSALIAEAAAKPARQVPTAAERNAFLDSLQAKTRAALRGSAN